MSTCWLIISALAVVSFSLACNSSPRQSSPLSSTFEGVIAQCSPGYFEQRYNSSRSISDDTPDGTSLRTYGMREKHSRTCEGSDITFFMYITEFDTSQNAENWFVAEADVGKRFGDWTIDWSPYISSPPTNYLEYGSEEVGTIDFSDKKGPKGEIEQTVIFRIGPYFGDYRIKRIGRPAINPGFIEGDSNVFILEMGYTKIMHEAVGLATQRLMGMSRVSQIQNAPSPATPTPKPTPAPAPPPKPAAPPKPTATPALTPAIEGTFTVGSTKQEVLDVMGTPSRIIEAINWLYWENSYVDFGNNNRVIAWGDISKNLKLR